MKLFVVAAALAVLASAITEPRSGGSNWECGLAPADRIPLSGLSGDQLAMATIYNEKGGYLKRRAEEMGVTEEALAGVLKVESGNKAFDPNNGMKHLVRLEAHVLEDRTSSPQFSQHFVSGGSSANNRFSATPGGTMQEYHGNQEKEWLAMTTAQGFDDLAALESASHGAAQVMGFNAESIGYADARAMFVAFSDSVEKQLDGMIEFIKGRGTCMDGLRANNYQTFARCYNGAEEPYGGLITTAVNAYQAVKPNAVAITEAADGTACSYEGSDGTCKAANNCHGWAAPSDTCSGAQRCCVRASQGRTCNQEAGLTPGGYVMFFMAGAVPIGGYTFYKNQQSKKKKVEAEARFLEDKTRKTKGGPAAPNNEEASPTLYSSATSGNPRPDTSGAATDAPADPPPPYEIATKDSANNSVGSRSRGSRSSRSSKASKSSKGSKGVKRHGSRSSRGSKARKASTSNKE